MVARANIAIIDGQGSPVTHTFTPNGETPVGGVLKYRNFNSTTPAASETLTLLVSESSSTPAEYSIPGKKVAPRKVEIRLRDPVTYTDSVTSLVLTDFVNEAIITLLMHPRATEQDCEDLRKMAATALTETNGNQVLYAVDKGEAVW